ncbi:MAG: glycogen-binding domain-containing protein [Phycisphaerae bacterium]
MVYVKGCYATFRFYRPRAREVYLAGTFNNWRPDELRMTPTGDGWWRAGLLLPPGDHRFRYIADGQWFTDYAAFGIEYGPLGPDSALHIPQQPGPFQRAAVRPQAAA